MTEALRPLQKAGLVQSHRGQITILDGAGLEARSCECYFVVRDSTTGYSVKRHELGRDALTRAGV